MAEEAKEVNDEYPQPSEWTVDALDGVAMECVAQDAKWGRDREIPDGTGYPTAYDESHLYRDECRANFAKGEGTWRDILLEEVYEVMAEVDPERLHNELIQVAAVAVQWAANVRRREVRDA